jgi:hypothetical protein
MALAAASALERYPESDGQNNCTHMSERRFEDGLRERKQVLNYRDVTVAEVAACEMNKRTPMTDRAGAELLRVYKRCTRNPQIDERSAQRFENRGVTRRRDLVAAVGLEPTTYGL